MLEKIKNWFGLSRTFGAVRSSAWTAIRDKHIKGFPTCALCGGIKKLNAHHILPFHLHPELELISSNLITLCEGKDTVNCHLIFGHFGNFKTKFNISIREEAKMWNERLLAKETKEL